MSLSTPLSRPVAQAFSRGLRHWLFQGAGGASVPSFPAKAFYFNDFNAETENATLRSLSGWSAYNSASSTSSIRDFWKVQSSRITRTAGTDSGAQPGTFIIGQDSGATNHTIRCKVSALPGSGGLINLVVGATAENNSVYMRCTNASGTMQSFIIAKNVGGTITQLLSQSPTTSGLGRPLIAGDTIEMQIIGQVVHLLVNGLRITATSGLSIDTGGAFVKGNICGVGTNSGSTYDDVYIAQLTAQMSISDTQIFWPGSIAALGRTVPLSGVYTGDVQALDYKVENFATGAVIKDWSRVASPSIAAGSWSCGVFVPMCDNVTNPKIRVRVRAANEVDAAGVTGQTCVGITVASYGQSNSHYMGIPGTTTYAVNGNTYTWSLSAESKWKGGDPTSLQRSQLWASQISEATGIPCGVCVAGVSSRTITLLVTDEWAGTKTVFDTSGSTGFIYSTLWTQGEAESAQSTTFNVSAYRGNFDTLLGLLSTVSINPAPSVGVCVIGKNTAGHVSGTTFGDANWSAARACLMGLADKPNTFIATNLNDAVMFDELHYVSDAYVENGRRAGLSMRKALGYGGYDGRGPLITGATRSGAVITLPINLNGAASVSGTGLTNYDVSTDDFATTKAISSVAVSGSSIVITLAADPGGPVKVRSFYGMYYGPAPVLAMGAYADGTAIPVEPLYGAVASA